MKTKFIIATLGKINFVQLQKMRPEIIINQSMQSIARDIAILYDYNYTAMTTDKIKQHTIYRSIFYAALPISTGINENDEHISQFKNAEDTIDGQETILLSCFHYNLYIYTSKTY